MDYEYACTNGTYIIGQPGSLVSAQIVMDRNYEEAHKIGSRARFDYRIVRRTATNKLDEQPGKWEPVDLVSLDKATGGKNG